MYYQLKKYLTLKTYFPKGITARFFLLIIFPILVSQFLTGYIFYQRHWKNITNQSAITFAGNVLTIVDLKASNTSKSINEEIENIAKKNFFMDLEWVKDAKISKKRNSKHLTKLSLKYVYRFLNQNLGKPYSLEADEKTNSLKINIQYPDGILSIRSSLSSVFSKTFYIFFIWILSSSVIFILFIIPFIKGQLSSIKKLTRVIVFAGKGMDISWFKPTGAMQIRKAGKAFLKTYEKMQSLMNSRTSMLTSISNDLKDPLTHMKLELEFAEDKNLQFALLDDISYMEKMIDNYLEFSKGIENEIPRKLNLTQILKRLVSKFNKGSFEIKFISKADYFYNVRSFAFEKAINHILINAIRYGNKKIIVSISKTIDEVVINIEDNGNGIPESMRSEVFKPFVKLKSDNNNVSGIGLGLSIVQDIIHQNNGDIILGDSKKLGGLMVTIKFPLN